jgi:type I restriction enzyme S subunit
VSLETYKSWFRSHPQPGDIILTNKGSQNGAICLVPDPVDFCIAQDMVALRANRNEIDPLYLFAALRSDLVQSRIKNLNVDAVIPHFKKTDFDKLLIPLPERYAQEYIGLFYYNMCLKIELNRRMNETLEAMARAIFKDWFVDFGPTRAKMSGRAAYLPEELWSLFPEAIDEETGLPQGWEEKTLGEISTKITKGTTPKKADSLGHLEK